MFGERPAVAPVAPAAKRLVVTGIVYARVAKDAPVEALAHPLDHHIGRGELHIGDPHMDELVVGVGERHRAVRVVEYVVAESLELHGVGAGAVDDLVKVVWHGRTLSLC